MSLVVLFFNYLRHVNTEAIEVVVIGVTAGGFGEIKADVVVILVQGCINDETARAVAATSESIFYP